MAARSEFEAVLRDATCRSLLSMRLGKCRLTK
jgi:hypothetical protein